MDLVFEQNLRPILLMSLWRLHHTLHGYQPALLIPQNYIWSSYHFGKDQPTRICLLSSELIQKGIGTQARLKIEDLPTSYNSKIMAGNMFVIKHYLIAQEPNSPSNHSQSQLPRTKISPTKVPTQPTLQPIHKATPPIFDSWISSNIEGLHWKVVYLIDVKFKSYIS